MKGCYGYLLLVVSICIGAESVNILVNTSSYARKMKTKDPFICVTLDWWPNNKCDSPDGQSDCSWIDSSILSLNINDPRIVNALDALGNVTLRLGGTLADQITYQVGNDGNVDCPSFQPEPPTKAKVFTGGCLTDDRWIAMLEFCEKRPGCNMIFGLNAMRGRECVNIEPTHAECFWKQAICTNGWNSTNARELIRYTAAQGYKDITYELGNELNCLTAEQYSSSIFELYNILQETVIDYNLLAIPDIIVTDSYEYMPHFLKELLPSVNKIVKAFTWHDYPLQAGVECSGERAENNTDVDEIIMNRRGMDKFLSLASGLDNLIDSVASEMAIGIGESGGAFNSGCTGSTNSFMSAFWYINSLGGLALRGHDFFCRQTLTGGNYELINKITHVPNPDYYAALLFGRLMSSTVLNVRVVLKESNLVVYAHCTPFNEGTKDYFQYGSVTLLYLNYNDIEMNIHEIRSAENEDVTLEMSPRYEYILTGIPKESVNVDNLHSDRVALNQVYLHPDEDGMIPPLIPIFIDSTHNHTGVVNGPQDLPDVITVPPQSYGFFVFPTWNHVACMPIS